MPRLALSILALLALAGCEPTPAPGPDAARGVDAAVVTADAASEDAAAREDAGDVAREDALVIGADAPAVGDASSAVDASSSDCVDAIAAIEAAAMNVWFLSESDRPLAVQVLADEGASAPTEATVVRLAMPPSGATSSTRATDAFARAFEPAPGAAAEAPMILEAAIAAGLRDLLYVAIVDPAAPAEVRVILAGRTRCGELVLIESVSIET